MSKCSRFMLTLSASLASVAMLLAPASLLAESSGSARMATYAQASGERYFALSVTPPQSAVAPQRDVLVLFDTSASQTGLYRDDALSALDSLLAELGDDRVQLATIDLWVEPMTSSFVAADSAEMKQALATLRDRAPLGATDMTEALSFATQAFNPQSKRERVLVYIGDGLSKANLLQTEEFANHVAHLVSQKTPVISLAIGPERDIQMLAALANHTGGAVYIDSDSLSPQQAGVALARMAQTPVTWPTEVAYAESIKEVYPRVMPPLRADRDTVVIGRLGEEVASLEISMQLSSTDDSKPVNFTVEPEKSNADLSFLPQLIEQVRRTDGKAMPTVGSIGLQAMGREMLAQSRGLTKLSSQAAASGNEEGARKLAEEALRLDPENPNAETIRQAVTPNESAPDSLDQSRSSSKPEFHYAAHRVGESPFRLVHFQQPEDGNLLNQFESEFGELLDDETQVREADKGQIMAEVRLALRESREQMASDPQGAISELKVVLEGVERSPVLDPATRSQLSGQIIDAIREGQTRQVVQANRLAELQEREAQAVERQQLLDELAKNEAKVTQLMSKFDALMAEGRYREAEEQIANQVREIEPDNPQIAGAVLWSRQKRYYDTYMEIRELRHRNFVDSMMQIERASIPFPDEPPIVYPSAEVWERLSISRKKYASVDLAGKGNAAETRIFAELDEPTSLEFIETSLADVVLNLSDRHSIPIVLDTRELDGVGIGTDTPITQSLKGISLRSALRLMLKELELTYVVRDEVLLITTVEEAESELVTKVYPVADLVLPISSGAGGNPFSMGGGFGGGGGQGGGGGGFGGGGGGFGGGGGGFGGGGGGGQGGFFAVADELRLGGTSSESANQPTARPANKPQAANKPQVKIPARYQTTKPLTVTPGENESVSQAWNRYFANLEEFDTEQRVEHNQRVRETVRSLMRKKSYDETSAFILAALRQGYPQSWMYEALGIAVQAKYAADESQALPKRELERIMMSAIDFSTNPEELLFAATYFSQIGLEERALKLYREVAEIQPQRPEAYIHGLRLANRLEDYEHKQWSSLGILRQPWSKEHAHIEKEAHLTAKATLKQLRDSGQQEQADQFEREYQSALSRDCVVRVTWTGDADIDILVEEPTGSVCSLGQQRSSGGGMILGDTFSSAESASSNGFSELYICPRGFSGEYRVLLKRIWGEVTAGKATIDIYTHYGTPQQTQIHRQIPLSKKDALVIFDLDEGRREELLADQQVAQVARQQVEVNRAVLASQMSTLESSQAVEKLSGDRKRQGNFVRRNRRGVGFMPVITTLPEGVNMSATAVISADRRYVRITALPLFSLIGDVSTFNFATGAGGVGAGGGNGGGIGGAGGAGGGNGGGNGF